MGFVNEYVSAEDVEKYGIRDIDKSLRMAHYKPHWTIDRDRYIYLRYVRSGREESSNRITYYFCWKGAALLVQLDTESGALGDRAWCHFKLWTIDIPDAIRSHKDELLVDLKDALIARKGGGVLSKSNTYSATFDF